MIEFDLSATEREDFEHILLHTKATVLSSLREKQRNLSAYGDRQWADRVRSEVDIEARWFALLNKMIEQLKEQIAELVQTIEP